MDNSEIDKLLPEQEIQRHGQYLKLVESVAGIGYWRLDLIKESIFWSDEVYKIHGVTHQNYSPDLNTAVDFYHIDDRLKVEKAIESTLKTKEPYEFELRLITTDGEQKYVHSKGVAESDENGVVVSIFGTFQDITERLHRERNRLLERQTHENFIEQSHDGFWDWYIKEDYIYISPRYWKMLGYDGKINDPANNKFMPFAFDEDYKEGQAQLIKYFKSEGERPFSHELRLHHKDGSTVYALCRGNVVEWDENGRAVRMVGTHTDITPQKKLQAELQDAINFQQLMMDNNPNLIFVKDEELRIVQANKRFLSRIPEGVRDTIIGTTGLEQFSKEQQTSVMTMDREAFEKGYFRNTESIHSPNGDHQILDMQKIRFEDAKGNAFIVAIGQNVTQQTKLQAKLQDSINFQQLMMDNNPNLIFVKDEELRIVQANKNFLSLYPEDIRDSIIGTTTLEQHDDDELKEFTKMDREAFEKGYSQTIESIQFPNGERQLLNMQKIRFYDGKGKAFILAIGQDVTQREILIEKLTDSNEQLERFAHVCSHDLSEPLRMVKSFTEMLEIHLTETTSVDEKAKRYMDFITNGATRGQQLVTDVLAYSKVTKDDRALETVDLSEVIADIKQDLPEIATLTYDTPTPIINANRTQIYQLFQNLISNGVKYQPEGQKPEVEITWEDQGEFWQFCIADNGIGMEPRHQEKIFEVFKRLHRYQAYAGTGIGLSICKKIVERYGGSIWMVSKLNQGSKVYFQLPK